MKKLRIKTGGIGQGKEKTEGKKNNEGPPEGRLQENISNSEIPGQARSTF